MTCTTRITTLHDPNGSAVQNAFQVSTWQRFRDLRSTLRSLDGKEYKQGVLAKLSDLVKTRQWLSNSNLLWTSTENSEQIVRTQDYAAVAGLNVTYAYSIEKRMEAGSANTTSDSDEQQRKKKQFTDTITTRKKGDERLGILLTDEHVPTPSQTLQIWDDSHVKRNP